MRKQALLRILEVGVIAVVFAGCVLNRPARNGVFNESQYVRKSFLIGDGTKPDTGWNLNATVTSVTTPNPLGGLSIFPGSNVSPGFSGAPNLVRFVVTEDKLQMVNMREITGASSEYRAPEVVNAWGATNVDLKYRVNLDGENTNFFEENQELDWQTRQFVKVKWAKNDMSDVAVLGSFVASALNTCTDVGSASATLVPNSFIMEDNKPELNRPNYMEWSVQITVPILFADAGCIQAYGAEAALFQKLGRQNVTFTLKYSMVRAMDLADPAHTYKSLVVGEKDAIRHKYGVFDFSTLQRDPSTDLLAARQLVMRFDPAKPMRWYFTKNMPQYLKDIYCGSFDATGTCLGTAGSVMYSTNQLLKDAGVDTDPDDPYSMKITDPTKKHAGGLFFGNYNIPDPDGTKIERQMGDVRYSMIAYLEDMDNGGGFLGITSMNTDVRTGETMSAQIIISNAPLRDTIVQRLDAYLQSVGASSDVGSKDPWADLGPCMEGDTMPVVADTISNVHNLNSSVYSKMQQYLQKPQSLYGNLGPQDFIAHQDADFFNAYYTLQPYLVYADPSTNQFTVPEGGQGVYGPTAHFNLLRQEAEFQALAAKIDRGESPYEALGPQGLLDATSFLNKFRTLTLAHQEFTTKSSWAFGRLGQRADLPNFISLMNVMKQIARRCVYDAPGATTTHWQSREEWITWVEQTFNAYTAWHEFGHAIGMEHNFMASVDRPNWATYKDGGGNDHYKMYSSSVMEYGTRAAEIMGKQDWGQYDKGVISWIYANNAPDADPKHGPGNSLSGQVTKDYPWKDPHGFKVDDMGMPVLNADGTQAEISFMRCHHEHLAYTPLCRQFDVGTTPSEIIANQIDEYEWKYKWSNFRLYRKFWDNSAYANVPAALIVDMRKFMSLWIFDWGGAELADTFRRVGIVNPDPMGSQLEYYQQLTDKFNKEASAANQMVGAFHKAIIQQSSGERPYRTVYDKFYGDVTQQGIILDKLFAMQGWVALWPTNNYDQNQAGSYIAAYESIGDASFNYVAKDTVSSMIGGQYDVFPYFVPLAVAQFAQDTHSPSFGEPAIRDWIGGHVFYRLQDFLDYFKDIAVQNNAPGCSTLANCNYDPRTVSDKYNEFLGPDHRQWIWAYVIDRNQWVAVQKDRNTASYIIVRNYTDDVIFQQDDGAFPGGAYGALLPMKYFLDSFNLYN